MFLQKTMEMKKMKRLFWISFIVHIVVLLVEYMSFVAAIYVPTLSSANHLNERGHHNKGEEPPVAHFYFLLTYMFLAIHTVLLIVLVTLNGLALFEQMQTKLPYLVVIKLALEGYVQFFLFFDLMLFSYMDYLDNVPDAAVYIGYVVTILILACAIGEVVAYISASTGEESGDDKKKDKGKDKDKDKGKLKKKIDAKEEGKSWLPKWLSGMSKPDQAAAATEVPVEVAAPAAAGQE